MEKDAPPPWDYADEVEYNYLKVRYGDRKELSEEAENKRKAFKNVDPSDALYHRMAVSAEMAKLRVDMAYIVDRNNRLEQMLSTVSFMHQRIDVLEGAYGYTKLLAEQSRIEYAKSAALLKDMVKLKEELSNAVKQSSHKSDGPEGKILPSENR